MERWKLWTAIASGLLSVGGGSAYYWWPPADSPTLASQEPAPISSLSEPPKPLPDPGIAAPASSAAWVSTVSYQESVQDGGEPQAPAGVSPAAPAAPPAVPSFEQGRVSAPAIRANRFAAPGAEATISDAPAYAPVYAPAAPAEISENAPVPVEGGSAEPASTPAPTPIEEVPPAAPAEPRLPESTPAAPAPQAEPAVPAEAPPAPGVPDEPAPVAPAEITPIESAPVDNPAAPGVVPVEPNAATAPAAPRLRTNATSLNRFREDHAPAESGAPAGGHRTSASPGDRRLEGTQAPSLSLQREAPEEIQVGKPTKFVIKVRNTGTVTAHEVVVTDAIPTGTRFLSASPATNPTADGTIAWSLGDLQPGQDSVLTLELLPESEGEIGSVADVTFRAQASVRTIATRPLLKVEQAGPNQVLIGQDASFQIAVSNPGTGVATGVVIEVDVPAGLAHDGGREIESPRFDLRPNETRTLDLVLRAVQPGMVENLVRAVGDGELSAEDRVQLEVIAPQLQLSTVGPSRRFLDRPVKYQIIVANPGTAPAQDIQLSAHLPRGLKFTSADKKGAYDQRSHAVLWSLEALPAGEKGVVELTALPTDTGEQNLHVEARGALGLEQKHDHITVVEDITDLVFTVTDDNVPIEVGSETTYQIRVANNGTKVARNVRLAIAVPGGLEVVDADGPTEFQQQGNQLLSQAVAELGPREEAAYRVTAKGTQAGDHVLSVQLLSDEFSTPVTKEEITKVYSDK